MEISGLRDVAGNIAGVGMEAEPALGGGARLMELVERIYAAAEDPGLWEGVLEQVACSGELLRPHLERAVRLQRRLQSLEAETVGLGAALEAAEQAVVCVDAKGRVVLVNTAAAKVLEAGEGLRIAEGGRMVCEQAEDTAVLRKLLAGRLAAVGRSVGAMKVQRRGGDGVALNVTAMPVRGVGEASMLLFLGDPKRVPRSRADVMRSLYGLTPTEGRVCDGLLEGLETREVAERMRTTLETARFHMKQILRKTGAARQQELVRLMMALPTMG
jgi:DNA-binding CsgD family transcriptional regulator